MWKTLWVVTLRPFLSTLSYGPASLTRLSPSTAVFVLMAGRLGRWSVEPDGPMSSSYSTSALSLPSAMVRIFHLPWRSAMEIGAGAAAAAGPAGAEAAAVVSAG